MIVDNDTIIGYGLGYADSTYSQQGLILSKFDSSGNHLFSRMILDSLGDHLSISYHWGKIAKTRDGGYIMTAAPFHRDAAWLIKVDHHFEVEFIKEYLDTINLSHYRYNAPIELRDGYLLSGGIQRPNYLNDSFARRVDQQGNTVWFRYYGNYEIGDLINAMAQINDTLFVLSGTTDVEGPNSARATIRFINGQGDIIRLWNSEPNPDIGYNRNILPTADGGLITFGVYLVEVVNETSHVQPTLAKLDSNFQTEWVRHFSYVAWLGADIIFWDLEQLSDGNYIGAGESVTEPGSDPRQRTGWLYKFSPEGDKMWELLPNTPFYPLSEYDVGKFTGVGELSSGSIVAAGEAIDFNQRYIWLVKVTPDGCLDTLCSMVTEVEAAAAPAEEAPFSLYPNPTAGPLTLAWPGASAGREARIRLFDAAGREVWRQQRRVERQTELSLDGLPGGVYFLQVQMGQGVWVEKVVLQEE
ncbi:MAG: T9SS type A sorting domain-containing protein [Phaeodactylibacter sp.]|nr:T9SS type A sorting domain-containing protein [Phaeodactylibacter sp.]